MEPSRRVGYRGAMSDMLPILVNRFLESEADGAPLLREVARNVAAVARGYPDAYFSLGQRSPEHIDELAHRVFTVCARVPKGRFPFLGRAPFRAYVDEGMSGANIRYHSFYARLSITRELLRDAYAANVVRDPALRWRAELYRAVGEALPALAAPVEGTRPAVWRLRGQGLVRARAPEAVVEALRAAGTREVPALVSRALSLAGPCTQSRLAGLLGDALQAEAATVEVEDGSTLDPATRLAVRQAVRAAWDGLDDEARALMRAVASGAPYETLLARLPQLAHKVALTRAVQRCNQQILARVGEALGATASTALPPQQLAELLLEVLVEIDPALQPEGAPS